MDIMNKTYKVVSNYESTTDGNPIILKKGDKVEITEKSEDSSQWENWVCCTSLRSGITGWVPVQALDINGSIGISIMDYTANELTVNVDDVVVSNQELNGWIWAQKLDSKEFGWIPLENVVKL